MNIRETIWDKQTQIKEIKKQIEYNNEHSNRLMEKWREHYNSITNCMVGTYEAEVIQAKDRLSQLDLSAIIEIIKNNKPC